MSAISLLDLDPDLSRCLEPAERAQARRALKARAVTVPRGCWTPPRRQPEPGHLGYLIIDGLLLREVRVLGEWSTEPLGDGDLLRPWLEDISSFVDARWETLEPTRLAALDAETAVRAARYPALVAELNDRALRRSRALAVYATLPQLRRVDDRLRLLFWHLAERWGRLTDRGVAVSLPLTHAHLGRLVAARRPSVTTALNKLAERGEVEHTEDDWVLRGPPPDAA